MAISAGAELAYQRAVYDGVTPEVYISGISLGKLRQTAQVGNERHIAGETVGRRMIED